jgi:hypothetical protein
MRRRALLAVLVMLLAQAPPASADRWFAEPPLLGIVDAGRQVSAAREAGATWDRTLFLWQEIQPNGANDWFLDRYVDQVGMRSSLSGSLPVVAVVQGTPVWAAVDWHHEAASVPAGLDYAVDDPRNTFGQFMLRLARAYQGRITTDVGIVERAGLSARRIWLVVDVGRYAERFLSPAAHRIPRHQAGRSQRHRGLSSHDVLRRCRARS